MKIWTTTKAACPYCGLESTHSKNCRWVMTLEQLFRAVRNNRSDFLRMGHHEDGDTLRCLADLMQMHPYDTAPAAAPKALPMPDPRIVGEVFAKDAPPPGTEAAAAQVLSAMRYARDFEREKWDALMTTEAGVLLCKAWDALKAVLPKK